MAEKTSLNCFFCRKRIAALKRSETRRAKGDHYEDDTYYEFVTVTPAGKDIVSLNFSPFYKKNLDKIIENAANKIENRLKEAEENTGLELSVGSIFSLSDYCGHARELFELRSFEYERAGVNQIVPKGFKAHASCLVPTMTLEQLAKNPYVKNQFEESLKSLPKRLQRIYDALKNELVMIIVSRNCSEVKNVNLQYAESERAVC